MYYYAFLVAIGILGIVLQSAVFSTIMIAGVKPDLLLLLVIFNSLFQGPLKGTVFGFFIGLLEDIYSGKYIGMNALAKGLTSLFFGWLTEGAFRENLLVPVLSSFLGGIFNGVIVILLGKMAGLNWDWGLFFWKVIPASIYSTCLVPFVYARFYNWVIKDKQEETI